MGDVLTFICFGIFNLGCLIIQKHCLLSLRSKKQDITRVLFSTQLSYQCYHIEPQ